MLESPSLCPVLPSSLRSCQLNGEDSSCRPERRQGEDARRRPHGTITMPLNSARLLSSDHITTQMRDVACPNNTPESLSLESLAALNRTSRAVLRTPATSRTPTPDPRDIPAPLHISQRRSTEPAVSFRADDTRRHGMVIQDALPPQQPAYTSPDVPTSFPPLFLPNHDLLPCYTPLPTLSVARMIDPAASPTVPPGVLGTCEVLISRQRELSSLRCQWTTHCRRCRKTLHNPSARIEHTRFRSDVARTYDLPPPYAPVDPYPLFSDTTDYGELRRQRAKRSVFWARMVLYPFIPETVLLDKAAYATAMGVEKVAGGVKKGVVSAGVRVMAVPGRIERGRAKRKIKWLQGKGFVEVAGEGGEPEGAERVGRVRVVPRAASTAAAAAATATPAAATATATATATTAPSTATAAQERPRNRTRNTDTNTNAFRYRHGGEWFEVTGAAAERLREERRRDERRREERRREERRREERRREERRREERRRAARSGEERPRADRPRAERAERAERARVQTPRQERPREERARAQTPREERSREERLREERLREETSRQETSREEVRSEVRDACIAYWHLGAVM